MTREEQIIKASQLYAKALQKPFIDGARWADQNPVNYNGKAMFYVLNKGHEQGYKDAIDKACKFFEERMWEMKAPDGEAYVVDGGALSISEFIRNFKEYMEEQQ